ncbi:MAG: glycosyltransferase family 9 protein [Quinella sp. 2Q5]|nr:glycosyltransferase family 9 protein [Quinella sp. 2Q5]
MKILVINLMHLGDLMLVTPALTTLRKNFPTAHLALLADKKLGDLVQHNPNLDECILIDKTFADLVRTICDLRGKNFDLVINLHRNERASALAALSGGKRIVGYAKPALSLLFDEVLPNPSIARHIKHGLKTEYQPGTQHQVHSHFDVLRQACGVEKIFDDGLQMEITDDVQRAATKIFRDNFADGVKVVAFNIGASWLTKRWLDSSFAECADILIDRGYGVAFLGGTMDREIVNACVAKMRRRESPLLKIFTGEFSLAMLAGFLDNCVLFLTTDSGPMHVGVARNIPIVTMFGASPVPGFYPYDAKDVLIRSPEPCHPCGEHICPREGDDNLACMKKISVAAVMKYVDELLAAYGQPAKEIPRVHGAYQCRVVDC